MPEYIRTLQVQLGLADWTIQVRTLRRVTWPDGTRVRAAIQVTDRPRKHADIFLPRSFANLTPDVQRSLIAHELYHLPLDAFGPPIEQLQAADKKLSRALAAPFEDAEHAVIDWLEQLVTPTLPLPTLDKETEQ
jgi:hypothetical protein